MDQLRELFANLRDLPALIKWAGYFGLTAIVFAETGLNPKLEIALELERIALQDDYFIKRKLYPNVDFYSGLIYQAMGYPTEYFTVLFALGRMPGWLAQWEEMLLDKDQKIARPRQIYTGKQERPFVPIEQRG